MSLEDSDSYEPSWAVSDGSPPTQITRSEKQKMIVEVVIPVSASKPTSPKAKRSRLASPTRSESSVSLGTSWHWSPKKRRQRSKRPATDDNRPRKRARSQKIPKGEGRSVHLETRSTQPGLGPRPAPSTIRVDLNSARLDNIVAQERSRATYTKLFTPPSSGGVRAVPDINERIARGSPLSRIGLRSGTLAASRPGPSTGPGTQQSFNPRTAVSSDQIPHPGSQRQTRSSTALFDAQNRSAQINAKPEPNVSGRGQKVARAYDSSQLPQVSFSDPDYDLWAQLGLRVAFERLVEEYGFSMDIVQKSYDSRGNMEDTEQLLVKMKHMVMEAAQAP